MFKYEKLFLIIFVVVGGIASFYSGISWDEEAELKTLLMNTNAAQDFFFHGKEGYKNLLQYSDRYYGIGFHAFSSLFSFLILGLDAFPQNIELVRQKLLFTHFLVFLSFIGSGLFLRAILRILTNDNFVSSIGMLAYLLWPYLLGHSFINVKDSPFLFAWVACTYIFIKILELIRLNGFPCSKNINNYFLLLGILTGWLFTIRISGILIGIEFFCLLASFIYFNSFNYKLISFLLTKFTIFFLPPLIFIVYVFYPIFWVSPFEIIQAFNYMGHHPWDDKTLTAGIFFPTKTRLYLYIPAWLVVKLPLLVIMGYLVSPFIFLMVYKNKLQKYKSTYPYFFGLFFSVLGILLVLILAKAALYNELRHLLFIFPMCFIVGFCSLLYLNKRILLALSSISICVFLWDGIILFPYQYTYFNEISRLWNVEKNYEKDYFAISVAETADWLNKNEDKEIKGKCLLASPVHLWKYRLQGNIYPCIRDYSSLSKEKEPFLFFWLVKDRPNLYPLPSCKLIHTEERSLLFSQNKIPMSQLFLCNPKN